MTTTSTRASAVSLLEKLRKVAEGWTGETPPGVLNLPHEPGMPLIISQMPGFDEAVTALSVVDYYDARGRSDALERLDEAIAALREPTP